jgi:hypothetical protein
VYTNGRDQKLTKNPTTRKGNKTEHDLSALFSHKFTEYKLKKQLANYFLYIFSIHCKKEPVRYQTSKPKLEKKKLCVVA